MEEKAQGWTLNPVPAEAEIVEDKLKDAEQLTDTLELTIDYINTQVRDRKLILCAKLPSFSGDHVEIRAFLKCHQSCCQILSTT